MQNLSLEIKTELLKLTNFIAKRCSICSTIQKKVLFAYEEKDNFYYVCSSCIIKLALNELSEQYFETDSKMRHLFRKKILSISEYIELIIKGEVQ